MNFGTGWVKNGSGQTTNGLVFTADATAATSRPVIDTTKKFTVMAWVNPSSLSADRGIVSLNGASSSRFALHFDKDANSGGGGWCASMTASEGAVPVNACTDGSNLGTPTAGQWVHVAAVFDPTLTGLQLRIYVMGDPESCFEPFPETAAVNFSGSWSATGSLVIGRSKLSGGSQFWRGGIDDVWAFQDALSGVEICQHAQP